jgi:hypothetical protein
MERYGDDASSQKKGICRNAWFEARCFVTIEYAARMETPVSLMGDGIFLFAKRMFNKASYLLGRFPQKRSW